MHWPSLVKHYAISTLGPPIQELAFMGFKSSSHYNEITMFGVRVRVRVRVRGRVRVRVRGRVRVRVRVRAENYRSDPLRSLPKSLTPERKVVELRSEEHTSELQSHLNLVC